MAIYKKRLEEEEYWSVSVPYESHATCYLCEKDNENPVNLLYTIYIKDKNFKMKYMFRNICMDCFNSTFQHRREFYEMKSYIDNIVFGDNE